MKAPFSEYLMSLADGLKIMIGDLRESFDYVSVLSTDSVGLMIRVGNSAKSVNNQTMTTERGTVVRVCKDGQYSEYALNTFDPSKPHETAKMIRDVLNEQFALMKATGTKTYQTAVLRDEPITVFKELETEMLPEKTDVGQLMNLLLEINEAGNTLSDEVIDVNVTAQSTHVCKMFLSENRDMRQSYVYSEGTVIPIVASNGRREFGYMGVSGIQGPEIFSQLKDKLKPAYEQAMAAVNAEAIMPGEYEIITTPEVTGLIAHEAFGHGVEMDQFVKHRALGAEYIDQRVGSDLVTMHEGALCAQDVTSYVFDDEGVLAGDVIEIDHGILKTGICDALSAVRLGIAPTGNGKRESYSHKAYTRMTNTIFDSGTESVEDMIQSVKYGYLLEGMESGMEDPKHWGIQCIIKLGREIKDGKLTGKVVAPVIMTGYVPDLLGNISMVSTDREVFGNGGCGKGHKEWVKVADGGPYLKTKGRLG